MPRVFDTYYNEFDRFAASWLRELCTADLIPPGFVDDRDMRRVNAEDLRGYRHCHFFAGIGGWPYALSLAGWPEEREVWTGSCPCQPFSDAGGRRAEKDERHLWPDFLRLIRQRRPATVFGEQVASKLGREWLSGVRTDLEELGYSVGAADLCAAGVNAPHMRQRIYWGASLWVGNPTSVNGEGGLLFSGTHPPQDGEERLQEQYRTGRCPVSASRFWGDFDIVHCRDNRSRRIEPGTYPLADGVPNRVGRLRGYGNAVVPQVAAVFVRSFLEATGGAEI